MTTNPYIYMRLKKDMKINITSYQKYNKCTIMGSKAMN